MIRRPRRVAAAAALAVAALAPALAPAGAAVDPVPSAVGWLEGQQQGDGGFEVAGYPGYETPDAILAIAAAAQTTDTWSAAEAKAAVEAVSTGGKDALDAVDAFAEAGVSAQQAAKVIALVAGPLGLDAEAFDPAGDGSEVDLVATMTDEAGDGSYPTLPVNGQAFVALALDALGEPVPAALRDALIDAQQANGGWNYAGDPAGHGVDPDSTGLVVLALASSAAPLGIEAGAAMRRGLQLLAWHEDPVTGGYVNVDGTEVDPNSTAMAVLAIAAWGRDPADPCWRAAADRAAWVGVPYRSPVAALAALQHPTEHRFTSPFDGWGVNTFPTSQAVQALRWARLPFTAVPGGAGCPVVAELPRFLNGAYHDVLGRLADDGGRSWFVARLGEGWTRSQVAKALTGSEYRRRLLVDVWTRVVGTPPDPAAVDGLVATMPRDLSGVQEHVLRLPAVVEDPGFSPEAWIEHDVYPELLGRTAQPDEVAYWVARLGDGHTLTLDVVRAIRYSAEARGHLVDRAYAESVRRVADPVGRAHFAEKLRHDLDRWSYERVLATLVGSAEYLSLTGGS